MSPDGATRVRWTARLITYAVAGLIGIAVGILQSTDARKRSGLPSYNDEAARLYDRQNPKLAEAYRDGERDPFNARARASHHDMDALYMRARWETKMREA